ncbi:SRR1-like protein [Histomonas meleagridis]|uniref:SRR1-like protein n=1 Tax=Histomonas meleagridis TaxID=135588 RepID=UPI0035598817|nr:SRR1-like protein [Histomonas meleagridis]KAH0800070.1 SRR1-like protein [Histomonas meleagridis]
MSRRRKRISKPIPIVYLTIPPENLEDEINKIEVNQFPAFDVLCDEFNKKGINSIRCLGIGDPCKSAAARLQTSFILKLSTKCNIQNITYFDPVLCESCRSILTRMGFECEEEDLEGFIKFSPNTAFYMPHCPRFLYHNLLLANWDESQLQHLIIVGNSFESYEEKVRMLKQPNSSCVEDLFATKSVHEIKLDFKGNDFFDSTSLMLFCPNFLPPKEDNFWQNREKMHPTATQS